MAMISLLAGCATWGQMDQGLTALHGKNIQAAVYKLGYPSGETAVAGMKFVTWSSSASSVMFMPQTSTSYGNVYGPRGTYTYNQVSTGTMAVPMNGACTITLRVNEDNIIVGHQYDGNMLGCERYIKALKRKEQGMQSIKLPADFGQKAQ